MFADDAAAADDDDDDDDVDDDDDDDDDLMVMVMVVMKLNIFQARWVLMQIPCWHFGDSRPLQPCALQNFWHHQHMPLTKHLVGNTRPSTFVVVAFSGLALMRTHVLRLFQYWDCGNLLCFWYQFLYFFYHDVHDH